MCVGQGLLLQYFDWLFQGLLVALQNASPKSLVVVFTDNGSKDLMLERDIVRLRKTKEIEVGQDNHQEFCPVFLSCFLCSGVHCSDAGLWGALQRTKLARVQQDGKGDCHMATWTLVLFFFMATKTLVLSFFHGSHWPILVLHSIFTLKAFPFFLRCLISHQTARAKFTQKFTFPKKSGTTMGYILFYHYHYYQPSFMIIMTSVTIHSWARSTDHHNQRLLSWLWWP